MAVENSLLKYCKKLNLTVERDKALQWILEITQ